MSEIKKEVELGTVTYTVKFEERFKNDPDWMLLTEASLDSPAIRLYFNYPQRCVVIETRVEPKIILNYHEDFSTVTVPASDVESIKNFAFGLLWDYIKPVTPLNATARDAVKQILKGLEVLVKARS